MGLQDMLRYNFFSCDYKEILEMAKLVAPGRLVRLLLRPGLLPLSIASAPSPDDQSRPIYNPPHPRRPSRSSLGGRR